MKNNYKSQQKHNFTFFFTPESGLICRMLGKSNENIVSSRKILLILRQSYNHDFLDITVRIDGEALHGC